MPRREPAENAMVKERDFLLTICHNALSADPAVRFAGIIDNNGKLLVGEYRQDIGSPLIKLNPSSDPRSSSFFSAYQSLIHKKKFEPDLGELSFQLTAFEKVNLLTVPLTARDDRYLCVSMDAHASYHKVVDKVLDTIG